MAHLTSLGRGATDRLGHSFHLCVSAAFDELIDRSLVRCTKEAHSSGKAAAQAMFQRITTRHIASAVDAPVDDGNDRPLAGPFLPDPVL